MSRTRRVADEGGFTMIELVVAIFIVVVVVGALVEGFVNNNDSAYSSQRTLSRFSVLQQQIERVHELVKQYGFSAVALTSAPTAGCSTAATDPKSPTAFVCGSGCAETLKVQSNYNNTGESFPSSSQTVADSPESLLVNGCTVSSNAISGGQLAPVSYVDLSTDATTSTVPSSDPYATIYTYVMQTSTAGCASGTANSGSFGTSCTGDVRRVVVAVVMSQTSSDVGANYPTYATTILANPVPSNQNNNSSGLKLLGLIT